jgi:hypothetical protein
MASLAFPPTAAAGGPHRDTRFIFSQPIVGVYPSASPAIAPTFLAPSSPRPRGRGFRRFATHAVPVIYVAPPAFYELPAQVEPPAPPAETPALVAPPPPPERDVIQYSDGRHELRGDGIATPYRWVWIPNPPPPPRSERDDRRLFGWIDEQGEMHVTDRWNAVPERYRAQAKRNESS